ncbi:Hypothetical predicted protein [Mytilus galloprovincialis]|uniref:EGF-like domain-containing protein n=1 Tax=Mytilus galloprovincialis TaxID=29158 RepID=A0A8B6C837_MYTGA|nr:Hypothetical predicted protein [Mytilus galloprovincialis]
MKHVLLFLCIFWIGCSCKNIPCYYEPINELECIEFIKFPEEHYGCSYTNKSLVFTGSSKLIGKELWIQVQKNQETFYVRRQDGACKDKCCDTFNRVDRAHHHEDHCVSQPCVNGGTCHNEEHDFMCTCKPGFYGTHCHHYETYHYISYGQQSSKQLKLTSDKRNAIYCSPDLRLITIKKRNSEKDTKLQKQNTNAITQRAFTFDTQYEPFMLLIAYILC